MKTILITLLAAFALVWAPTALADVAPDPGDDDDDDDDVVAEETCTAENQEDENPGFTCEECVGEFENDCVEHFEGTSYELVCFDTGEPSTAVWCGEDTGPSATCAVAASRGAAGALGAMLALFAVAALRRRLP